MALDDRTAQAHLTPEERRDYLRAFADRMLIKVTSMDDPEDLPGVERAVRVASVIERLYSRCDRSEAQAPDPLKVEAERARHAVDAIEQRVVLANTLQWGEKRRQDQGHWWDHAKEIAQNQAQTPAPVEMPVAVQAAPESAPQDMTETAAPDADALPANLEAAAPVGAAALARSEPVSSHTPETAPALSQASLKAHYADFLDGIRNARAALGLPDSPVGDLADLAELQPKPPPPS